MRTLGDFSGQFHALRTLRGIITRQRIRPEQERTQPADLDADLVRHLANLHVIRRAMLRRKIIVEIVVQLDAVESRVFGQLHALTQRHALWIRKSPLVDRLQHLVLLHRSTPRIGCGSRSRTRGLKGQRTEAYGGDGGFEGVTAGKGVCGRVHGLMQSEAGNEGKRKKLTTPRKIR